MRIPQPKLQVEEKKQKGQVRRDLSFGWKYLRARQGLFGLLWYFAMVNFLLNFAGVLTGPLVLSSHPASAYGLVQTTLGAGRGIGLMFVVAGIFGVIISALVYLNPSIRNVEEEIPDALPG